MDTGTFTLLKVCFLTKDEEWEECVSGMVENHNPGIADRAWNKTEQYYRWDEIYMVSVEASLENDQKK